MARYRVLAAVLDLSPKTISYVLMTIPFTEVPAPLFQYSSVGMADPRTTWKGMD